MPSRVVHLPARIDLALTLGPLRRGSGDPTMRVGPGEVWRASRTPDGAATVRLIEVDGGVRAEAWGPGAAWLLEHAPAWVGALDDPTAFAPAAGVVRDLHWRFAGLRIPSTGLITERLIPIVLEQKVTGAEARRAYRRMATALGEAAPGPADLVLPPDPSRLAAMPYERFHPFGIERRRAGVLRGIGARAAWLDAATGLPLERAKERIGSLSGIGPWSVAEVARLSLGDADAVSVGDFHAPNVVAWALAREPRGTDERMLELLEPYRPHRGRVQLLLEAAQVRPPAFGPRMEPRAIDRL
ncbi:MAG TPA: DNA-3-methyladenine glycosylase 2 family protein [Actinomycetota bacterium]|nr:DNA-3-methyladenine glycosylase 2 family protein [Actinomycetota bacterium]